MSLFQNAHNVNNSPPVESQQFYTIAKHNNGLLHKIAKRCVQMLKSFQQLNERSNVQHTDCVTGFINTRVKQNEDYFKP